jgi:uncharacterized protein (DUF433 family)
MAMTRLDQALTASEAGVVTGVPLKQVHRIIDAGLLDGRVETRKGARVIVGSGLLGLKLAYVTAEILTLEARRRVIGSVLREPQTTLVRDRAVTVELRPIEAEVEQGLGTLERARAMVTINRDVLGGTPCIGGTRVPVHDIAEMLANGDGQAAILAAWPQLTADQVELAAVYAAAYPRRGRPRRTPAWRKASPKSSRSLRLDELPSAS